MHKAIISAWNYHAAHYTKLTLHTFSTAVELPCLYCLKTLVLKV